ncbi:hypothetical protein BACOVA_02225 [Bacteroides ovatus ATCC 8483]|uniref:Uncharacterized protein n=1 Tax=Bacteroides ovatus (strain ATCC 8483 / DSM 1896 / JCM 5824 / BCRC 10623 / CCUG 4943 / NCTC 11153) TaxID=411476 RepID=A0AAN3A8B2_BACO1|nr:hypothetical protein BACOVA_02225 [Bacteroides ovatus ATCC 8483]
MKIHSGLTYKNEVVGLFQCRDNAFFKLSDPKVKASLADSLFLAEVTDYLARNLKLLI